MDDVSPSDSRQTTAMFPAPSDAIRGAEPDAPAGEMSSGLSSPPAAEGNTTSAMKASTAGIRRSRARSTNELTRIGMLPLLISRDHERSIEPTAHAALTSRSRE